MRLAAQRAIRIWHWFRCDTFLSVNTCFTLVSSATKASFSLKGEYG
jgi:hypothetical protein